jgi:hypothetical protein
MKGLLSFVSYTVTSNWNDTIYVCVQGVFKSSKDIEFILLE